ncbi:MAG: TlpA disulfide reductase family protein [Tidjanibacter sp.]|nr:TlpA disulfide reductase family protein [Tidjanibacter sp.]
MKKYLITLLLAAALCSCSTNKARLGGEIAAAPETAVYLEQVGWQQNTLVDSTLTDSRCRFRFVVSLPDAQPTLYNVRCKNERVTLLLSPRERVKLNLVPGILDGYNVQGSNESELIKEVNDILVLGSVRLDSIRNAYSVIQNNPEVRRDIAKTYMDEYYRIKREHISFIVRNAGSLAAVYALNQRLAGDETLFNGRNDIVYYRLVADSVAKTYPSSPYLAGLRNTITQYDQNAAVNDKLQKAAEQEPLPFPEIELPDMYGRRQSLLAQRGNVILLDFWSVVDSNAAFHNADLKELYSAYHDKGFEIYQVSVDSSKPGWIETVQKQKLPWISVNDFKGGSSPAVLSYNVKNVPTNYLIDREGNIMSNNLFGDDLKKAVKAAVR